MNSARPYGDQVSATTLVSSKYYYASFSINPFRTIVSQRLMKSQWNIYDGGFCKNSLRLLAVIVRINTAFEQSELVKQIINPEEQ